MSSSPKVIVHAARLSIVCVVEEAPITHAPTFTVLLQLLRQIWSSLSVFTMSSNLLKHTLLIDCVISLAWARHECALCCLMIRTPSTALAVSPCIHLDFHNACCVSAFYLWLVKLMHVASPWPSCLSRKIPCTTKVSIVEAFSVYRILFVRTSLIH